MRTPEGIEKQKVKAFLTEIGACHRWPVPFGYGAPDIDCHASIGGHFWAIETKREGEQPTPTQWRTLADWEQSGARVAWGTAADIIPVIERWIDYRANGGPLLYVDADPHANAAGASRRHAGSGESRSPPRLPRPQARSER